MKVKQSRHGRGAHAKFQHTQHFEFDFQPSMNYGIHLSNSISLISTLNALHLPVHCWHTVNSIAHTHTHIYHFRQKIFPIGNQFKSYFKADCMKMTPFILCLNNFRSYLLLLFSLCVYRKNVYIVSCILPLFSFFFAQREREYLIAATRPLAM